MVIALLGMRISVNLRTVERWGERFYAKGKDLDGSTVRIVMDKFSAPNLMASTYGYAHVLFIVNDGKIIKHDKYYSLG